MVTETLDGLICLTEGAVPLTEVYARLYRHALELARASRIAQARELIGLSEDEYARRFCGQYGFPESGVVVTVTSATNVSVSGSDMW
jgi:hypothetical protein